MNERSLDEAIAETARMEVVGPVARRVDRAERKSARGLRAAVAITILGLLLNLLWSGWNTKDIAQNEARVALSEQGLDSLRSANEELRRQGLPEIPEPKAGEPFDADALAAAAAAILKDDIKDDPTFKGPSGLDGSQGQQGPKGDKGDQGDPGFSCTPDLPECRGDPGVNAPVITQITFQSDGESGCLVVFHMSQPPDHTAPVPLAFCAG